MGHWNGMAQSSSQLPTINTCWKTVYLILSLSFMFSQFLWHPCILGTVLEHKISRWTQWSTDELAHIFCKGLDSKHFRLGSGWGQMVETTLPLLGGTNEPGCAEHSGCDTDFQEEPLLTFCSCFVLWYWSLNSRPQFARQVLYHLNHTQSTFGFSWFSHRVSC
jgi:hypothetical protein